MMGTDNPFERVLDRLREKGWCKGTLGDEDGPNCLYGGANWEDVATMKWSSTIRDIVVDQYPERAGGLFNAPVVSFNNHLDTTFEDVERVLEKAAIKWEEEAVTR